MFLSRREPMTPSHLNARAGLQQAHLVLFDVRQHKDFGLGAVWRAERLFDPWRLQLQLPVPRTFAEKQVVDFAGHDPPLAAVASGRFSGSLSGSKILFVTMVYNSFAPANLPPLGSANKRNQCLWGAGSTTC